MNNYLEFWKLLAGLGLFLFGMRLLESALKALAGKRFRQFLRRSTNRPISSVFGGVIATTIVQSSSLVSLIVLAFVGAGIIPLVNAIGIVIGSNLGTTFTGWIVATLGFKLDLSTLIYPLMAIGGLGYGLLKRYWQSASKLIFGLALLLMGLDLMKDSVAVLTEHADIKLLSGYPLIVYVMVGVIFTAIIQSSSATMMLTLSALYAEIIPLPAAAALVIGADLGTTSTVLLGSLQGTVAKRRLAMAHVLFNLSVDTFAYLALLPLLALIEKLQIEDPLYGLVAFHSLFNLFGLVLFLPFIKYFAEFLEHRIKTRKTYVDHYIHSVPETIPDAALEALYKETQHLLNLVIHMNMRFMQIETKQISTINKPATSHNAVNTATKREQYIVIKKLEGEIINYALKIKPEDQLDQSEEITNNIDTLMKATRSAVYSAKALKDIDDNLQSFSMLDTQTLTQNFDSLKHNAVTFYELVPGLFADLPENQSVEKELVTLLEKSHNFHQDIAREIYQNTAGPRLSALDLSTLLNVNKEIQTSDKALIKSIFLLSKSRYVND